jgi:hypothetical protein
MPETAFEYLNKHGYTDDDILTRFRDLLRYLQKFITVKRIAQSIKIDMDLLKKAVIDYFIDTVRIKEFHNIPKTRTEKIYGYTAYWLLKRKPIQVTNEFTGSFFINESFVSAYLINGMFAEKNLTCGECVNKVALDEFVVLLVYNLKYRQVSQQSLELMIKAFYSGCDFPAGITAQKQTNS